MQIDSVRKDKKEFLKNKLILKTQQFLKNKLILKTQQRFKSERYNVFTEEINKFLLIQMTIKECSQQKHMHMERAKIQFVRNKKLNLII